MSKRWVVNAVRVSDWALHSFIKTRVASENMTDIIPRAFFKDFPVVGHFLKMDLSVR